MVCLDESWQAIPSRCGARTNLMLTGCVGNAFFFFLGNMMINRDKLLDFGVKVILFLCTRSW
jgi:hypothetical protein